MRERALSALFIVITVVFLGLTFWLLLVDKTSYGRSGIAFLTAALCVVFGHIGSIASFKAMPTSFEAKMREVAEVVDDAKATLKNLHEIAAMAGATLIDVNAGMGRFGGGTTTAMKDARRAKIIQSLKSVALSKEELALVATADKEWVAIDYCQGIFAGWASQRNLTPDEQAAWGEFSKAWKGIGGRWPSPDECHAFMDKLTITDLVARELLEDYRYYVKHGEHRRPQVWSDRDNWLRR
jgi:hypothetical protein